jgi:BclB C-terminal domain-containing protein
VVVFQRDTWTHRRLSTSLSLGHARPLTRVLQRAELVARAVLVRAKVPGRKDVRMSERERKETVGGFWLIGVGLGLLSLAAVIAALVVAGIAFRRSGRCARRGRTGTTGPAGTSGSPGSATSTGATGSTGAPGAGAILGLASYTPVTLTTLAGGLADLGALIGFGSSVSAVNVSGATVSLVGAPTQALNEAFDAPRAGTITAISANYSNVAALALGSDTADVTVQLYHAAAGTTTFSPLAGVAATIPLTGTIVLGTAGSDLTTGLAVPVVAGDRYLLVASLTTTGIALVTTLSGYLSAGLAIS